MTNKWLLSDEEIEDEHENYYLSDYKYGWYKWLVNAQAEHMKKKIEGMPDIRWKDTVFEKNYQCREPRKEEILTAMKGEGK